MKIWKFHYRTSSGESEGFSYGKTKKEAISNAPHNGLVEFEKAERIAVKYSRQGIIDALNRHGDHPNNG